MASALGRMSSRVCVSTFAAAELAAAAQATCAADPYNASISQLLRGRANKFVSATPATSVVDAAGIMARRQAGSVLVFAERALAAATGNSGAAANTPSPSAGGAHVSPPRLEGIVTERDVMRYLPDIIREARDGAPLRVCDIMSRDPRTVEASATVGDCMEIMINGHFRHLPVMDHGELIGVLSIRDLVEKITDEHRTQVTDLRLQLGRLANVVGEQLDDSSGYSPSRNSGT